MRGKAIEIHPPMPPAASAHVELLLCKETPLDARDDCPCYLQRWDGRFRRWRWLCHLGLSVKETETCSMADWVLLETGGGRVGYYRWAWVRAWRLAGSSVGVNLRTRERINSGLWEAELELDRSTIPHWFGARA